MSVESAERAIAPIRRKLTQHKNAGDSLLGGVTPTNPVDLQTYALNAETLVNCLRVEIEEMKTNLQNLNASIDELADETTKQSKLAIYDDNATLASDALETMQRLEVFKVHWAKTCQALQSPAVPGTPDTEGSAALERQVTRLVSAMEGQSTAVKLPDLPTPTFDGDYANWVSFWDLFAASIDRNPKLSACQKLQYLLRSVRGDALKRIQGLALTNDNYAVAVSILKQTFANAELAMSSLHRRLFAEKRNLNSVQRLRDFHAELERTVMAMEAMGFVMGGRQYVDEILSMLPHDVMIQIETKRSSDQPWTLPVLRRALTEVIQVYEAAARSEGSVMRLADRTGTGEALVVGSVPERQLVPRGFAALGSRPPAFGNSRPPPLRRTSSFSPRPNWAQSREFRSGYTPRPSPAGAPIRNPGFSGSPSPARTVNAAPKGITCWFCRRNHYSSDCFFYPDLVSRRAQLGPNCRICLRPGHHANRCNQQKTCIFCRRVNDHHPALCPSRFGSSGQVRFPAAQSRPQVAMPNIDPVVSDGSGPNSSPLPSSEAGLGMDRPHEYTAVANAEDDEEDVIAQTVLADVRAPGACDGQKTRLVFDSCSSRSYISENLAQKLQLAVRCGKTMRISRFGTKSYFTVTPSQALVEICLPDGQCKRVPVRVVKVITGDLVRVPVPLQVLRRLPKEINLADTVPRSVESMPVEFLLGGNYYLDFLTGDNRKITPGLHLIGTVFGYVIAGRLEGSYQDETGGVCALSITTNCRRAVGLPCVEVDPPGACLENLWELEGLGIRDDPAKTKDQEAEEIVANTLRYDGERYEVGWPWKANADRLPSNRGLALGRFQNLARQLDNDPNKFQRYNRVMEDQLDQGVIEEVVDLRTNNKIHYLPHHAVETPLKLTTKTRVVYDCAARTRKGSPSLNSCLHTGPPFLENLGKLLLRFRHWPIVLLADIARAFLQISLRPEDRDTTRFFWYDMRGGTSEVKTYRFRRILFGAKPSPYLLHAVIDHHLSAVGTPTADRLKGEIYVDNLVTGTHTPADAVRIYKEGKKIFDNAGMNMRDWCTNCNEVANCFEQSDRGPSGEVKVLGIGWHTGTDEIKIQRSTTSGTKRMQTKRDVLSSLSTLFDPLGLFTPITIKSRMLLQTICKGGASWDSVLGKDLLQKATEVDQELGKVGKVTIPRFAGSLNQGEVTCAAFCDASEEACCAAVYIMVAGGKAGNRVSLSYAKGRVNPIKPLTIPKLELVAAVLGIRAMRFVESGLKVQCRKVLFSDSQCVLGWIRSSKAQDRFVENRLSEVRAGECEYRYVPTRENPADLGTRWKPHGELPELWWKGPVWLERDVAYWPAWGMEQRLIRLCSDGVSLGSKAKASREQALSAQVDSLQGPLGINASDYSRLLKLHRVTAWCLRAIKRLKGQPTPSGRLTAMEILAAEFLWVKKVQECDFGSSGLGTSRQRRHSVVYQLGLRKDSRGVLRCHGRLAHAPVSGLTVYPILLPKQHPYTLLVIRFTHEQSGHCGTAHTLAELRKRFWVPHGRTLVKGVIRRCTTCKRYEGGSFALPPMPDLPSTRLTPVSPFTHVGVDFFGPLYVDDGCKVWVALFVCLTVRAVWLERVRSLAADDFVMALRRFTARCGRPRTMISDNAPSFRLTSEVDHAIGKVLASASVQDLSANKGIEWKFVTEYAPWKGGVYEALVKSVKRVLKKVIGQARLTDDQLVTLLAEAADVVNSRPLVYVGGGVDDRVITPNSFLVMNERRRSEGSLEDPLDEDEYKERVSTRSVLLDTWLKGQRLLMEAWRVFKEDYLAGLREGCRWNHKSVPGQVKKEPKVGQVVLVKGLNVARSRWPLARILNVQRSEDGKVRAVTVQLSSRKILNRPLNHVYPMEVDIGLSEDEEQNGGLAGKAESKSGDGTGISEVGTVQRPRRLAASDALVKMRQMINA